MGSEDEIILHRAVQQPPLRIEVPQMPVHIVLQGIDLQDFLERGNRLQGGPFRTKGCGSLHKCGHGTLRRMALEVQVTDRIEDAAIAGRFGRKPPPLSDNFLELPP